MKSYKIHQLNLKNKITARFRLPFIGLASFLLLVSCKTIVLSHRGYLSVYVSVDKKNNVHKTIFANIFEYYMCIANDPAVYVGNVDGNIDSLIFSQTYRIIYDVNKFPFEIDSIPLQFILHLQSVSSEHLVFSNLETDELFFEIPIGVEKTIYKTSVRQALRKQKIESKTVRKGEMKRHERTVAPFKTSKP